MNNYPRMLIALARVQNVSNGNVVIRFIALFKVFPVPCFAGLSRERILVVSLKIKTEKNTQLVTKSALSIFRAFRAEKHSDNTQTLSKFQKEELNELLVDFYPECKEKTGGNYKRSAL